MNVQIWRSSRQLALLLVAILLVLAVSACGGDDDDGGEAAGTTAAEGSSNPETPAQADATDEFRHVGSPELTTQARTAGRQDALTLTKEPVPLPQDKSIGLILLSRQSTTSVRIENATRQIGRLLGYSVYVCDPNFDPQKVQQCGTSILAQNPSLMISNAHNPGAFGASVGVAAERGIPWISIGNQTTPAENWVDYGKTGFDQTQLFDEWYFQQVAETSPAEKPFKLLSLEAPTVGLSSANSDDQLEQDAAAAGFELFVHDLDLSNIVQDTLNAVKQSLQQHPDLAGISTYCDLCIPLVSQAVRQVQGGDRTTVIGGQFSTPQTVSGIREGSIDGVADSAWEAMVWVSVDQALNLWAFEKPIVPTRDVYGTYNLPGLNESYMITKANAGESGPVPIFGPDFVTYFTTKWRTEFSDLKG